MDFIRIAVAVEIPSHHNRIGRQPRLHQGRWRDIVRSLYRSRDEIRIVRDAVGRWGDLDPLDHLAFAPTADILRTIFLGGKIRPLIAGRPLDVALRSEGLIPTHLPG